LLKSPLETGQFLWCEIRTLVKDQSRGHISVLFPILLQ
jgi:hypothetical protein